MWGASVAGLLLEREELRRLALDELAGVGDPNLGEWIKSFDLGEFGHSVLVRRRLSAEEARLVGPVVDIRGTAEAAERLWKVAKLLPVGDRDTVLSGD